MAALKIAPSPFEQWATDRGYNIAPAVLPDDTRAYADAHVQELYEAWSGGKAEVARMLTESTLDTPALREKIRTLAGES